MVRLIATDLDGTLIPAGKPIPPDVLEALRQALAQGVPVVPASGRSLAAIPEEILSLPGLRYVISSNGAMIQDVQERKLLRQVLMAAPEAAKLLRMLVEEGVYSCVYCGNRIYNWQWLPEYLARYFPGRMPIFRQNPREDLAAFLEEQGFGVEKIFIAVHDPDKRRRIRDQIRHWPQVQITSSSDWNLEINRLGADKGSALAWLAARLGVPQEETAALGDNENDRSMLAFAGRSAAPESAEPEIRALAGETFPPCQEGGAAQWIRKLLEEKSKTP